MLSCWRRWVDCVGFRDLEAYRGCRALWDLDGFGG